MTEFRVVAIHYLRAQTLTQITDLTRRSYKGYSTEEREALKLIASVVAREILEKRRVERMKETQNEAGKANS